jgi:hypothetical protein
MRRARKPKSISHERCAGGHGHAERRQRLEPAKRHRGHGGSRLRMHVPRALGRQRPAARAPLRWRCRAVRVRRRPARYASRPPRTLSPQHGSAACALSAVASRGTFCIIINVYYSAPDLAGAVLEFDPTACCVRRPLETGRRMERFLSDDWGHIRAGTHRGTHCTPTVTRCISA